jgi:DnaK suppressor protein
VESRKPPKARRIHQDELNRIRSLLSQKRDALTNHLQTELVELEKPEKKHRTDLEEIASDTHETDSVCEIMGIESTQIDQIERALTKIDNGTYGICEDCGDEIPIVRLEALPFATQCIACKRRQEIAGQISSAADSTSKP